MICTNQIPIKDRGFLFSDGFFTTIRYDQKPFFFKDHMERLEKSSTILKIPLPWNHNFLKNHIDEVAQKFKETCVIKLIVTRGIQKERGLIVKNLNPSLYTVADTTSEPWIDHFSHDFLKDDKNALSCSISHVMRFSKDPLSSIKKLNYVIEILSRIESNYQDMIMLNEQDHVCCTTVGNVVIQTLDGDFLTPDLSSGCVDGIMRKNLIRDKQIREHPLTIDHLKMASCIFMVNSLRGIRRLILNLL
jgi:branched-chain amino acid aminotransferase